MEKQSKNYEKETRKTAYQNSVVTITFFITYLVLMIFPCIEFIVPIKNSTYSIKFYEIPMLIFEWSKYISGNSILTAFITVCIVATALEVYIAIMCINGIIKIFKKEKSAISSIRNASIASIILSLVVMISLSIIKSKLSNYIPIENIMPLPPTTVFLLILGIVGVSISISIKLSNQQKLKQNSDTKKNVTSAMLISVATMLNFIKIFSLPFGGEITLASMMPIIIIAYIYGTKTGILSAFAYSLIQMILGYHIIGSFFLPGENQMTVINALSVCVLDYIVAYTALGFASVFKGKMKKDTSAVVAGTLFALCLRYIVHIISGTIFFGSWAGWFFTQEGFYSIGAIIMNNFSGLSLSIIYSIFYNGLYMIPEIIITTILTPIVYSTLKKAKVL